MNIAVCISSVPDTTSKINFTEENTKFDTSGIQFVINPYDEFGLTKAIKIKEELGANITVINVGDEKNEPVIRKALAIGADNAIRINANPKDSYSTGSEIAAFLKNNPVDLIIAGRESIDYNGGAVHGIIAEILDIPLVNACVDIKIEGESAKLIREIDGGQEMISTKLPLIIGGQKGLVQESELRIPNMRGIMQARTKPLRVIDSLINKSFSNSEKFEKPRKKEDCRIIDSNNIGELINILCNDAKVI